MANRKRLAANKSITGNPKKKKSEDTGTIKDSATSNNAKGLAKDKKHNVRATKRIEKGNTGIVSKRGDKVSVSKRSSPKF